MTSKPTNMNGTMIITPKNPAVPLRKKGSMLDAWPPVKAPVSSMAPMRKRKSTTKVCTIPAVLMPRMLIQVITTAPATPTSAQNRNTSEPAMSQSLTWLICGKM